MRLLLLLSTTAFLFSATSKFNVDGTESNFEVETFTWEKLDCQEETKTAFNL